MSLFTMDETISENKMDMEQHSLHHLHHIDLISIFGITPSFIEQLLHSHIVLWVSDFLS